MNGGDIWQTICKFLSWKDILHFCELSKKHNEIGKAIIKTRALVVDLTHLEELISWVYANVTVSKMHAKTELIATDDEEADGEEYDYSSSSLIVPPNKLSKGASLEGDEVYEVDITTHYNLEYFWNLKSNYTYEFHLSDEDRLMNEEAERKFLPLGITLDTLIYLEHPLVLINDHNINEDTRGTKFPKVEFGDFYDRWTQKHGLMTIKKIAEACFRVKSHKFENWYEMMHGTANNDGFCLKRASVALYGSPTDIFDYYCATLSVDHGS